MIDSGYYTLVGESRLRHYCTLRVSRLGIRANGFVALDSDVRDDLYDIFTGCSQPSSFFWGDAMLG